MNTTEERQALVVDDSKAQRSILRRLLREHGFSAREALHGRDAIDQLEGGDVPELVLLDWNMPVMDGLTCLKTLRASRRYDDMRIVMVTSEASFETVVKALASGADEYIMKPCDAEMLADKLAIAGVLKPVG